MVLINSLTQLTQQFVFKNELFKKYSTA